MATWLEVGVCLSKKAVTTKDYAKMCWALWGLMIET
jgi:hypothetical protein